MDAFEFQTVKRIIARTGSLSHLATECQHLGISHALFITDQGVIQHNLHLTALQSLHQAGIQTTLYHDVQADPPEHLVLSAVEFAKAHQIDGVIGFGGGSSMDVAKLIAFLSHPLQKQQLNEIYGVNQAIGLRLPLIQIPTTAGTGSEVTAVAIVTTGETMKSGIVSPILYADTAILDAELTLNLPAQITAATGIDAMVHAIEAYTSKHKKNIYTDMLAKQALVLLNQSLPIVLKEPNHLIARQNMLVGAMLAGQAFANAPVAAVHALAYPLGGHCHLSHGHSNALVLTEVLRFNATSAMSEYAELMQTLNPQAQGTPEQLCQQFIDHIQKLCDDSGLVLKLQKLSIDEHMLEIFAKDAMLQTRLLINNPREMTEQDALNIYKAVYA